MIESRYSSLLKRKLDAHRRELLAAVMALPDWGATKQLIGRLQGLDDAAKLADDTDYEISGGG